MPSNHGIHNPIYYVLVIAAAIRPGVSLYRLNIASRRINLDHPRQRLYSLGGAPGPFDKNIQEKEKRLKLVVLPSSYYAYSPCGLLYQTH